jgi:hypothetical protein
MPDVFKEKYATTRVIIDCTEIFIQRPTSTNVQQLTWSSYKQHNTAKALIGVTPNLFISFLPDIQPGRLSDKEIVVRSGLVDLLEPGDLVMADRGFTIDDLLSQSVELNIPPFLCNKTQFNRQEVAVTRSIVTLNTTAHFFMLYNTNIFILCHLNYSMVCDFVHKTGCQVSLLLMYFLLTTS